MTARKEFNDINAYLSYLAKAHGTMLTQMAQAQEKRTQGCDHRKGGKVTYTTEGAPTVQRSRPTAQSSRSKKRRRASSPSCYAVIHHTFANGDVWVTCLHCGKRWKPGHEGYREALVFPTNNRPSGAVQVTGEGFVERFREYTKNS